MSNLVTLLRQSVVDISAFTVDAAGSTVTNYGTAFFIYKDFLITSASVVIVDNRKPPSNYYIQRAQRITGVVHSTNDSNTEVIMKLIGISPINDIAVLQAINPPAHSVLSWGNSQTSVPGITVYTIGNLLNEDPLALSSGVLRDNSLSYIANPNMAQLIDTDIALGGGMGGAPIVDGSGNVLGVVSFTVNWLQQSGYLISTGTVVGVSQYTAQFIFEQMAEARYCELIIDPLGNWLRWMPTSFGASFKYVQAIDLITLNQGLASTITNATPETLQAPFVLDNVKGAMVTGLTPGSDLANYLYEGDIIESVFGFPIGYETSKQLSISGALWTIILGL